MVPRESRRQGLAHVEKAAGTEIVLIVSLDLEGFLETAICKQPRKILFYQQDTSKPSFPDILVTDLYLHAFLSTAEPGFVRQHRCGHPTKAIQHIPARN
jgi:hypothetical protein